jgi:phosphatidylinositol-binding clathrin assembly protein
VRVQAESNRDMRNNSNIEEDMAYRGERPTGKGGQPTRSKTLMGRKLRVMTVEKGLLRETKAVQRMIDSLVECRVCPLSFCYASVDADFFSRSSIWMIWEMN